MTSDDLRAFEREVADAFEAKKIKAPIHLSDGNEEILIEIFKNISKDAWIFSTWRSHFHALLHGVPRDLVMSEILAGRSMMLHFPQHRFFTSAIVGGILPIAVGVAARGHEVFCFVGDMTAAGGIFHECEQYAIGHDLPIHFVVEDNKLATNTPTLYAWGRLRRPIPNIDGWRKETDKVRWYSYTRTLYPHVGSGKYVAF